MIDTFKKGLLAGIGLTVTTKDKVESVLGGLVEKGKLSSQEARETADKIVEESRKEYEQSREDLSNYLTDLMHKANFATQDQVTKLEARIAKLEKQIKESAKAE